MVTKERQLPNIKVMPLPRYNPINLKKSTKIGPTEWGTVYYFYHRIISYDWNNITALQIRIFFFCTNKMAPGISDDISHAEPEFVLKNFPSPIQYGGQINGIHFYKPRPLCWIFHFEFFKSEWRSVTAMNMKCWLIRRKARVRATGQTSK